MSENGSQARAFQFNARQMELLRVGDPKAEEVVITAAFSCVDQFVRAVQRYGSGYLNKEDAEDIVFEFFEDKLGRLIAMYKFCEASDFSAKFFKSLRNFAYDWLDRKMRHGGRDISLQTTIGDGDSTLEDLIPSQDSREGGLNPQDMLNLEDDVRKYIAKWTDNPVHRWILDVCLLQGWSHKKASDLVPVKFPGKVYEPNSVYSLVHRIRKDPGFIRIKEEYFSTKGTCK